MCKSNRKSKKRLAMKERNKPELYPNSKINYFLPYDELDLEHIQGKNKFKSIQLVNNTIYITTHYGDEFYIEAVWNSRIGDYVNTLHHKNTKHNTDKFHEEHKYFANVFMIFGYIRHHQHKPFDNTRTPQIREMDKMARLFKQIACC